MRILLVHNYYQSTSPSGEDTVFKNELELLRSNNISVIEYNKSNDSVINGVDKIKTNIIAKWSKQSYDEITSLIRKEKPDIVHFHNIWYLISPSAYYACQDLNVPVVQTLHNFRLFCINGLLLNNGRVCEKCIAGSPYRGAVNRCYRQSLFYSFPIASILQTHQSMKTWNMQIDAFISLSEFSKKKYIQYGLPVDKIFIKPNFYMNPAKPSYSNYGFGLFAGRLSREKGIDILLNASNILSSVDENKKILIKIVGDGAQGGSIKDRINNEKINNVELLGLKNHSDVIDLIKNSRFIALPSICYEGFPLVIGEAYACGKPIITSRLGAMAELVEDGKTGLLFEPGNARDLADKIRWMYDHEDECIQMGKNARKVFEEKYTAEKNFEILMNIYKTVLDRKARSRVKIQVNNSYPKQSNVNRVKFQPMALNQTMNRVGDIGYKRNGDYFSFSNIHLFIEGHKNKDVKNALNNAVANFPDGKGISLSLKILGVRFKGRVRGSDMMQKVCEYAQLHNRKIFLYGNTIRVLERLQIKLKELYPGINIVGAISPPFRELIAQEDREIINQINKADPDFLFVSLGAPKQELWMAAHKGKIKALQFGVGAAFDFIAGTVKEAPKWMQQHALEWLYRLPQQPRKTIKRMMLVPQMWWLLGTQLLLERILKIKNYQINNTNDSK